MKCRRVSVFMVGLILILATLIFTSSAQEPVYPDPGTSSTNIVFQNTDLIDTALVSIDYYDMDGNLDLVQPGISMGPRSVREFKTENETVLGDGWLGSAAIATTGPLASIVSIRNQDVPGAADGFTQGAYNVIEGATRLYFPSVFRFQHIVSRLTVQNIDRTPADIYLHYFDRQGRDLGVLEATLPVYAERTFFLGDPGDVPVGFPAGFVDGSVTVTSTNRLVGAAVTTWGDRSAAYQALTDANRGTTLFAPSHFRFDYGATATALSEPPDLDRWALELTLFSALNLQNTSASATANVTATYYSRDTGALAMTKVFTIASLSARGLNTKNGGDFPASDFYALSYAGGALPDWDGSVVIESDQPLVGVCNTGWDDSAHGGAYALITENDAASTLFVPAQYRIDWGLGWAQWSAINLMNVGISPVSRDDLSIEYIGTDGNEVETFSGTALPFDLNAGAALGMNTMNGGDLDASAFAGFPTVDGLPRFIGGIYITAPAGSKLIGVANVIYFNRASVYNAFPGN